MTLADNTAALQQLLEKVNALPSASGQTNTTLKAVAVNDDERTAAETVEETEAEPG